MTPGEFLLIFLAILVGIVILMLQNIKWVRVAQRVHYLPGEVHRIERLWLAKRPLTIVWWGLGIVLAVLAVHGSALIGVPQLAWLALLAPSVFLLTPWRFPLRGVTSTLQWTTRAIRVFVAASVLQLGVGALAVWLIGVP